MQNGEMDIMENESQKVFYGQQTEKDEMVQFDENECNGQYDCIHC